MGNEGLRDLLNESVENLGTLHPITLEISEMMDKEIIKYYRGGNKQC